MAQLALGREDVFAHHSPARTLSLGLAQNARDLQACFFGPHQIFERYFLKDEGWRNSCLWDWWWWERQCEGGGTGAARSIQAPTGLQTAVCWKRASASPASLAFNHPLKQLGAHGSIHVWGEPFSPLCLDGLCLPYPKAPAFVLRSEGPFQLCAHAGTADI